MAIAQTPEADNGSGGRPLSGVKSLEICPVVSPAGVPEISPNSTTYL
jgi:hypothetical protein